MIGQIKSVSIRYKKVVVETNISKIVLPISNLVIHNNKIVGIKLFDNNIYIPLSLLIRNNVKIQVDPRLPYHI